MINNTMVLLGGLRETTAPVVDYYLDGKVFYPIFEFKDAAGSTITSQGIDGSTNKEYKTGGSVQILYNPINPVESVRISTFWDIWLVPIFLTMGGAFILALSLVLFWGKLRAHDRTTRVVS